MPPRSSPSNSAVYTPSPRDTPSARLVKFTGSYSGYRPCETTFQHANRAASVGDQIACLRRKRPMKHAIPIPSSIPLSPSPSTSTKPRIRPLQSKSPPRTPPVSSAKPRRDRSTPSSVPACNASSPPLPPPFPSPFGSFSAPTHRRQDRGGWTRG